MSDLVCQKEQIIKKLQEKTKHADINQTYDSIYQTNSFHQEKQTDVLVDYQTRRKAIKDILNGNSQLKPQLKSLKKGFEICGKSNYVSFKLEGPKHQHGLVDEEGLYEYYQQYKQRLDRVENLCRKFEHSQSDEIEELISKFSQSQNQAKKPTSRKVIFSTTQHLPNNRQSIPLN